VFSLADLSVDRTGRPEALLYLEMKSMTGDFGREPTGSPAVSA